MNKYEVSINYRETVKAKNEEEAKLKVAETFPEIMDKVIDLANVKQLITITIDREEAIRLLCERETASRLSDYSKEPRNIIWELIKEGFNGYGNQSVGELQILLDDEINDFNDEITYIIK